MLAKLRHRAFVVGVLAIGVVFAMPLAAAFGTGVDAANVPMMKNAGATAQYGQTWVGAWMKTSGWSVFETDMRTMRDNGAIPVVMWYYWGDSISTSCVSYGCSGRTKGEWDSMARDMATRAKSIMGSSPFLVVLEPEFNKNGISSMESFDGYLADQARAIKAIAPNAKIVVGFGYWGGWDIFDRAVAASDYTGFQLLRGSTRDSQSVALGAADQIITVTKQLKAKFGKDVVMFDLAIATYGGWEWVQEKVLQSVQAKRAEMDAAGMRVLIWRYVYDNGYSSGYYGPAESTWGVKYANGGNKAGYDDLLTLIRGSSGTTLVSAPAPTTTTTTTSTATGSFTEVSGNNWWIQAKAPGSPTRVEARVNGGSPVAMARQSWGPYAVSTYAPTGAIVQITAVYADGSTIVASYSWPSATPTSATVATDSPTGAASFDASFTCVKASNWWTQACVTSGQSIASVDVRVNGGSWMALTKQSWGGWARSFAMSPGSKVEFRATSTSGATDVSTAYTST